MHEGIAGITASTAANGIMVHRKAVCVLSTRTWTRVRALVIDARPVLWTFGTDDATRSAGRWDSGESRLAEAHCVSVVRSTIAIGSAWRWIAGIDWHGQRRHDIDDGTTIHWIASVTRQTGAHRRVIDYTTSGILAASAGARINTLIVQTGLAAVAVSVGHAFGSASNVWITKVLR